MTTSVLDPPGISLVPDEALMKDISRQHNAALTELYGRHRQRLKAIVDSVVHEEAEADDVYRRLFSRFGTRQINIHQRQASRLAG